MKVLAEMRSQISRFVKVANDGSHSTALATSALALSPLIQTSVQTSGRTLCQRERQIDASEANQLRLSTERLYRSWAL